MWVSPGPGLTVYLYTKTMPQLKKNLKRSQEEAEDGHLASLGGRPEVIVKVKTPVL